MYASPPSYAHAHKTYLPTYRQAKVGTATAMDLLQPTYRQTKVGTATATCCSLPTAKPRWVLRSYLPLRVHAADGQLTGLLTGQLTD